MTNLIATDSAKQSLGSLVYFYDIEASSTVTLRYHNGVSSSLANVTWYDYNSPYSQVTYTAMPIKASGESRTSMGSPERPSLNIGVIATTLSSDLASANIYNYGDLVGKKVTIRATLAKYLNGGSADTGVGNPPIEFPKSTYLIESITSLQGESITYELTSPFDTQGITIPNRRATANLCSWVYKGLNLPNIGPEYSACYWPDAGNWVVGGISYRVYFNVEDEPIVDSSVTFTTYTSGSVTENTLYKTTSTETRLASNGATSSVTVDNYWQAATTTASPGTPSDTNSNFRRVRVYDAYNASATYYSFEDTQHNEYVRDSDGKVWQVTNTITGEAPGFNAFWTLGDVCGKKLNSCAIRYGIKPLGSAASTVPSTTTDTTKTLPFGGFPGLAKKLLR
jgi:lambda family phage minor tail protein L